MLDMPLNTEVVGKKQANKWLEQYIPDANTRAFALTNLLQVSIISYNHIVSYYLETSRNSYLYTHTYI